MGIIAKVDALEKLNPYVSRLLECVEEAWQTWTRHAPLLFKKPRATVRANALSQLIEDQVRMRLGSVSGLRIMTKGQRFLLGVHGHLVLRFKKLDDAYRTSTYPTPTANAFDGQGRLPFLEDAEDLPRITIGYRLNTLATKLLEVVAVFAVGNNVLWREVLRNDEPVQELLFEPKGPIPSSGSDTPARDKKPRIKLKGAHPSKKRDSGLE
ncbi:hypothetical protein [Corallococcus exiguus]|uniref:hypothetical protein n=1 Tax=Corallococcus exiguus TaxID=83462 RepID=UPI0014716AA5|nr:hypothetical protein [Corallococcus exiguus]NNB89654.1 hypothetical protein [Corallococcus exiguus]